MCDATSPQVYSKHTFGYDAPYLADDVKECTSPDILNALHVRSGSSKIAAVQQSAKVAQGS